MSGIYIHGMDMPTRCEDCPCFYPEYNECNTIVGRWVDGKGTPPSDCPIVPVPEHGRLIDGDKVFKRLQKQAMSVWGDGNPRYQIVLEVMDAIRFAPTIIPADKEGK